MSDTVYEELTEEELEQAIAEAENLLVEGLGTPESEKIQEKTSIHQSTNRQLQLKKDIEWLEDRKRKVVQNRKDPDNPYGRTYRKVMTDYGV